MTLLSGAHGVIVRRSAADVSTAGELLPFVTTKTRFGGRRTWLECPGCKTPRRVLYDGAGFRCRACHGLSYMTQRERPWARSVTRIQRLRERLGGSGNLSLPFPPKPKGMHWRTYRRLEQLEGRLVVAVAKQYAPAREG